MSLIRLLRSAGEVQALLRLAGLGSDLMSLPRKPNALTRRCHAAVAALLFTSPAFTHNGD